MVQFKNMDKTKNFSKNVVNKESDGMCNIDLQEIIENSKSLVENKKKEIFTLKRMSLKILSMFIIASAAVFCTLLTFIILNDSLSQWSKIYNSEKHSSEDGDKKFNFKVKRSIDSITEVTTDEINNDFQNATNNILNKSLVLDNKPTTTNNYLDKHIQVTLISTMSTDTNNTTELNSTESYFSTTSLSENKENISKSYKYLLKTENNSSDKQFLQPNIRTDNDLTNTHSTIATTSFNDFNNEVLIEDLSGEFSSQTSTTIADILKDNQHSSTTTLFETVNSFYTTDFNRLYTSIGIFAKVKPITEINSDFKKEIQEHGESTELNIENSNVYSTTVETTTDTSLNISTISTMPFTNNTLSTINFNKTSNLTPTTMFDNNTSTTSYDNSSYYATTTQNNTIFEMYSDVNNKEKDTTAHTEPDNFAFSTTKHNNLTKDDLNFETTQNIKAYSLTTMLNNSSFNSSSFKESQISTTDISFSNIFSTSFAETKYDTKENVKIENKSNSHNFSKFYEVITKENDTCVYIDNPNEDVFIKTINETLTLNNSINTTVLLQNAINENDTYINDNVYIFEDIIDDKYDESNEVATDEEYTTIIYSVNQSTEHSQESTTNDSKFNFEAKKNFSNYNNNSDNEIINTNKELDSYNKSFLSDDIFYFEYNNPEDYEESSAIILSIDFATDNFSLYNLENTTDQYSSSQYDNQTLTVTTWETTTYLNTNIIEDNYESTENYNFIENSNYSSFVTENKTYGVTSTSVELNIVATTENIRSYDINVKRISRDTWNITNDNSTDNRIPLCSTYRSATGSTILQDYSIQNFYNFVQSPFSNSLLLFAPKSNHDRFLNNLNNQQLPESQQSLCKLIPNQNDEEIEESDDLEYDNTFNTLKHSNTSRASDICPVGERSCDDASKCLKPHQFCDGEIHCKDSSDELFCSCKSKISKTRLCDGYYDCPNGEDELECFGCDASEFNCDDWSPRQRMSTCIPLEQRCDGISHCPTRRDEQDCSLLTDKISNKQHFVVGRVIGFLYKNYKGRWYPTCRNSQIWANDICQIEAGPTTITPLTHLVSVPENYNGPFINAATDDQTEINDNCDTGMAIHVECPPLICGMRVKIRNPYRTEEVDTSAEQILRQYQSFNISNQSNNTENFVGESRVVGGTPSQPEAWPWIVSVYRNGIFHCGGALINDEWVVTAAHCINKYWHYYFEIQAGVLRRYSYSPMVQNRMVSNIIGHQMYDQSKLKNDIALMKLSKPVKFNRYVRPICLPSEITAGKNFMWGPEPGTLCTAVGWGATVEHGSDPDHLREVKVPVNKRCKHREDQEGQEICAGLHEGGKDACQGDSGGPFMCRNPNVPNQWYLAGIVSHGEGCARPNEPGVYTRVSLFLDWLFEHIKSDVLPQMKPLHRCPGYICKKTNRCIANKRRCDKIVDCLHADDETNCDRNMFHHIFKHAMRHIFLPEENRRTNINVGNATESSLTTKNLNFQKYNNSTESILKLPYSTANFSSDEKNETNTDSFENITETSISASTTLLDTIPFKFKKNQQTTKTFTCTRMFQELDIDKKCNKKIDCEDGSDEENCLCVDYLYKVNPEVICDGITNCLDQSDELNCQLCNQNEYRCLKSGNCIPKEKQCNSVPDCLLEDDEQDCLSLTDGRTIVLDEDFRPHVNESGILSINHKGTWHVFCGNWNGTEATIASDICFYLGYNDYKSFLKLLVNNAPLKIIQSTFPSDHNKSVVSEKCQGLFIKCSKTINLVHNEEKHIIGYSDKMIIPPWYAEIYVDGKYNCSGSIVDDNWIITSSKCLDQNFKLTDHYVTILVGAVKSYLDVAGPHEQVIQVGNIVSVDESDISLLYLKSTIKLSRYTHPMVLDIRDYPVSDTSVCLTVGRNLNNKTNIIYFEPKNNCSKRLRCFKRITPFDENCFNNTSKLISWSGTIVCKSKYGFYPAAVYHEMLGTCGLYKTTSFTSLQYRKSDILNIFKQGYSVIESPRCNGMRCSLGNCINTQNICDTISDCRDGSDESHTFCVNLKNQCSYNSSCNCLPFEMKCPNGKCIPKTAFCDKINDCDDWSDEPDKCTCGSYLALAHPEKNCDGIRNCFDKSDEDPNICKCKGFNFVCKKSNKCVSLDVVCDGYEDCPNGEDELHCVSLRASLYSSKHEVHVRTSGVWHPGCFSKTITTLELEEICSKIGYNGKSATKLHSEKELIGFHVKTEPFTGFSIHQNHKNKMTIFMRSGDSPFVKLYPNRNCSRLFLECL